MIDADTRPSFSALCARLIARARRLGAARAAMRRKAATHAPARRWRDARLLWPTLFKD